MGQPLGHLAEDETGDGGQVLRPRLDQGQPGDLVQFARAGSGFRRQQAGGVGHEEAGVEAAAASRRGDGAGDIAQGGQVGQGAHGPKLAPWAGDGRGRSGAAEHQAGLLEGLAHGGQGQGAGSAGRDLALEQGGGHPKGLGRRGSGVVGAVDPAAGEDPFGGHEDVTGRATAHQHLGCRTGADEDQGGGVPGPLPAADAGGVGQILAVVEGVTVRGVHRAELAPTGRAWG